MISGEMYCLDNVLKTGEHTESHYLLIADGDSGYEISFGRQRKLNVSSECYIVTFVDEKFKLDKVKFNGGECDYLEVLKDGNISYEIPKTLPPCHNRMYSRFENAIDYTYWSPNVQGFFGKNGYAMTSTGYIGDDRYDDFDIDFCLNPDAFHIGKQAITRMAGHTIPKDDFIVKLLEDGMHIEEGEPLMLLFKEIGIWRDFESIQFITNDDE